MNTINLINDLQLSEDDFFAYRPINWLVYENYINSLTEEQISYEKIHCFNCFIDSIRSSETERHFNKRIEIIKEAVS